jgi:hypothetical protein
MTDCLTLSKRKATSQTAYKLAFEAAGACLTCMNRPKAAEANSRHHLHEQLLDNLHCFANHRQEVLVCSRTCLHAAMEDDLGKPRNAMEKTRKT